jgi:hypothetical protein
MAILKVTIDIHDAAFAENTAVMGGLAEARREGFRSHTGEGVRPATAMCHTASYSRATGREPCSMLTLT